MAQILNAPPPKKASFGQQIAGGLLGGAIGAGEQYAKRQRMLQEEEKQNQMMQQENQAIERLLGFDASGIREPKMRAKLLESGMKALNEQQMQQQKQEYLSGIFGGNQGQGQKPNAANQLMSGGEQEQNPQQPQGQQGYNPLEISDEDIVRVTSMDSAVGRELRAAKDSALKQQENKKKGERSEFESERAYHTQFSKPAVEELDKLRTSLPKHDMAIDLARNAIESGEVGSFTMNHLADIFGADSLRSAKGAQLVLAAKEQLIPTLSRISAKAQNQYMEKRMASMIPQIGNKNESNLSMQEMIEGESALDKAYLSEFDRLADEDNRELGFERKDIKKRAQQAAYHKQKEIVKRTSYRLKDIEEQEKGLSILKSQVGKNVIPSTPLTLSMARLYKDKFGDDALKVAEKNGYYVPSKEEFIIFQQRPVEYREML